MSRPDLIRGLFACPRAGLEEEPHPGRRRRRVNLGTQVNFRKASGRSFDARYPACFWTPKPLGIIGINVAWHVSGAAGFISIRVSHQFQVTSGPRFEQQLLLRWSLEVLRPKPEKGSSGPVHGASAGLFQGPVLASANIGTTLLFAPFGCCLCFPVISGNLRELASQGAFADAFHLMNPGNKDTEQEKHMA